MFTYPVFSVNCFEYSMATIVENGDYFLKWSNFKEKSSLFRYRNAVTRLEKLHYILLQKFHIPSLIVISAFSASSRYFPNNSQIRNKVYSWPHEKTTKLTTTAMTDFRDVRLKAVFKKYSMPTESDEYSFKTHLILELAKYYASIGFTKYQA